MVHKGLWAMLPVLLATIAALPLVPVAWAQREYKTLHSFSKDGKGGSEPDGALILDRHGDLYGTTAVGGAHESGTVFKLTRTSGDTWSERVLYSFCSVSKCDDGSTPIASLISDASGNLYGTTVHGGANGVGTVFKLSPRSNGGWTESVLYSFCSANDCGDGWYPAASLILDQAGNLYGTTEYGGLPNCQHGCGVVFKLTPSAGGRWSESVLHSFCSLTNCVDGAMPAAGLTSDATGNLYGTTAYGGESVTNCDNIACGVAFELTPNSDGSWTESVLYSFCSLEQCSDGSVPLAGVIMDKAGNLYGTTFDNFLSAGFGVVFQLTPRGDGGWDEKVIHQFADVPHGLYPQAGLVLDKTGNLYGTTYVGGDPDCYAIGCGAVFKLTPTSKGWRETVLHAFYDSPGAFPSAAVILDAAGNVYGTTQGEQNTNFGSVFEIGQ